MRFQQLWLPLIAAASVFGTGDAIAQTANVQVESVRLESNPGEPLDIRYRLSVPAAAGQGDLLWARLASEFQYTLTGNELPTAPLDAFSLRAERGADGAYWLILHGALPAADQPDSLLAQLRVNDGIQLLRLDVPSLSAFQQAAAEATEPSEMGVESPAWQAQSIWLVVGLLGATLLFYQARQHSVAKISSSSPDDSEDPSSPRVLGFSANPAEVQVDDGLRSDADEASSEGPDSSADHPVEKSSTVPSEAGPAAPDEGARPMTADVSRSTELLDTDVEASGTQDRASVDLSERADVVTIDVAPNAMSELLASSEDASDVEPAEEDKKSFSLESGGEIQQSERNWPALEQFLDMDALADVYGHQDEYGADLQMMGAEQHYQDNKSSRVLESEEAVQLSLLQDQAEDYDRLMDDMFGRAVASEAPGLQEGAEPVLAAEATLPPLDQAVQLKLAKAAVIIERSGDQELSSWLLKELARQPAEVSANQTS